MYPSKENQEQFNQQMIDAGLDWDYRRQLEVDAKIDLKEKRLDEAMSILQELIDEGTLADLLIKYNRRDGFSCRKLFNVANILDKPF